MMELEKKTYGWLVYHLLCLEKKEGKFVLKNEDYRENKYGLQQIYLKNNKVTFVFYFGRSMCHRPQFTCSLEDVKNNTSIIKEAIRWAENKEYISDVRQFEITKILKQIGEQRYG